MTVGETHFGQPRVDHLAFTIGFLSSLFLHIVLFVFALFAFKTDPHAILPPPQVFTVTLEGGEKLGGISQVPDKNAEKGNVVPLKPGASAPARAEESGATKSAKKEFHLTQPAAVNDPEVALKKRLAEEKRIAELKRLAEEKKRLEKERQEKARQEEEAKKKAEAEKKQREEEEKAKLEAKLEKEKLEKEKQEQEKAEKEKANKEKAEKEKAAKAEADRQKKLRDQALDRAIAQAKGRPYTGESAAAGGEGFGAASLGGKGFGGGTLASAEFIGYQNALEAHIKGGWRWLPTPETLVAQVTMILLPDGTIQSAEISKSSGNKSFDDSVLRAVFKSSPVPAPPQALYNQFREVRITFDTKQ